MDLMGLYIIIGIFTGLLTGLLGGGSGPMLIPILSALFIYQKVPSELVMRLAVGTALGIAVLAMMASMHSHRKHLSEINGIVMRLLPGGVIGSVMGTVLATYLSCHVFKIIFGIVIICIAFYTIYKLIKVHYFHVLMFYM